jgi:hypothetical protein
MPINIASQLCHCHWLSDTNGGIELRHVRQVTDEGIAHIASVGENLRVLNLDNCNISDISLNYIASHCHQLEELHVGEFSFKSLPLVDHLN